MGWTYGGLNLEGTDEETQTTLTDNESLTEDAGIDISLDAQ